MDMMTCTGMSICHLKGDTEERLRRSTLVQRLKDGWPDFLVSGDEFGLFLTVPERDSEAVPEDLAAIFAEARQNGDGVVRLDPTCRYVRLPRYPRTPLAASSELACLRTAGDVQIDDAFCVRQDVRRAVAMLAPGLDIADWSGRPASQLWDEVRPRLMRDSGHCIGYDFLAELEAFGARVVDLSRGPEIVLFEGAAAALREVHARYWPDAEFPGFVDA